MKFVPSAVKTEVMLARILKRMLKFTTKSLHVVKSVAFETNANDLIIVI